MIARTLASFGLAVLAWGAFTYVRVRLERTRAARREREENPYAR